MARVFLCLLTGRRLPLRWPFTRQAHLYPPVGYIPYSSQMPLNTHSASHQFLSTYLSAARILSNLKHRMRLSRAHLPYPSKTGAHHPPHLK